MVPCNFDLVFDLHGNHGRVSKMDASRNILLLNVSPIYSNECDFIYLSILFNCKIEGLKKVNGNPGRRGICGRIQAEGRKGNFSGITYLTQVA